MSGMGSGNAKLGFLPFRQEIGKSPKGSDGIMIMTSKSSVKIRGQGKDGVQQVQASQHPGVREATRDASPGTRKANIIEAAEKLGWTFGQFFHEENGEWVGYVGEDSQRVNDFGWLKPDGTRAENGIPTFTQEQLDSLNDVDNVSAASVEASSDAEPKNERNKQQEEARPTIQNIFETAEREMTPLRKSANRSPRNKGAGPVKRELFPALPSPPSSPQQKSPPLSPVSPIPISSPSSSSSGKTPLPTASPRIEEMEDAYKDYLETWKEIHGEDSARTGLLAWQRAKVGAQQQISEEQRTFCLLHGILLSDYQDHNQKKDIDALMERDSNGKDYGDIFDAFYVHKDINGMYAHNTDEAAKYACAYGRETVPDSAQINTFVQLQKETAMTDPEAESLRGAATIPRRGLNPFSGLFSSKKSSTPKVRKSKASRTQRKKAKELEAQLPQGAEVDPTTGKVTGGKTINVPAAWLEIQSFVKRGEVHGGFSGKFDADAHRMHFQFGQNTMWCPGKDVDGADISQGPHKEKETREKAKLEMMKTHIRELCGSNEDAIQAVTSCICQSIPTQLMMGALPAQDGDGIKKHSQPFVASALTKEGGTRANTVKIKNANGEEQEIERVQIGGAKTHVTKLEEGRGYKVEITWTRGLGYGPRRPSRPKILLPHVDQGVILDMTLTFELSGKLIEKDVQTSTGPQKRPVADITKAPILTYSLSGRMQGYGSV